MVVESWIWERENFGNGRGGLRLLLGYVQCGNKGKWRMGRGLGPGVDVDAEMKMLDLQTPISTCEVASRVTWEKDLPMEWKLVVIIAAGRVIQLL
jgi:hypothetical protein